jgi:hypothetical protein
MPKRFADALPGVTMLKFFVVAMLKHFAVNAKTLCRYYANMKGQ